MHSTLAHECNAGRPWAGGERRGACLHQDGQLPQAQSGGKRAGLALDLLIMQAGRDAGCRLPGRRGPRHGCSHAGAALISVPVRWPRTCSQWRHLMRRPCTLASMAGGMVNAISLREGGGQGGHRASWLAAARQQATGSCWRHTTLLPVQHPFACPCTPDTLHLPRCPARQLAARHLLCGAQQAQGRMVGRKGGRREAGRHRCPAPWEAHLAGMQAATTAAPSPLLHHYWSSRLRPASAAAAAAEPAGLPQAAGGTHECRTSCCRPPSSRRCPQSEPGASA